MFRSAWILLGIFSSCLPAANYYTADFFLSGPDIENSQSTDENLQAQVSIGVSSQHRSQARISSVSVDFTYDSFPLFLVADES